MPNRRIRIYSLNFIPFLILALVLVLGFGIWGNYRVAASTALRQAKNINLSLRLISMYNQSNGSNEIFDPAAIDGLTDAARDQLYDTTDVEGTFTLLGWNRNGNVPSRFTYETRSITVNFILMDDGQSSWVVEARVPVIKYEFRGN